jgi:5-methylcytosine-specific restriction endonuclease McrA
MTAQKKVLVLNKCWRPITITSLHKAITLLFNTNDDGNPKAKIIDPINGFTTFTWDDWSQMKPEIGEDTIKSGMYKEFRIPEIIMLTKYDKLPQQKVNFSRKTIYERDKCTCQYCGEKFKTDDLTIDHVLPKSKGGKTTWENCVLACVLCNKQKADNLLENTYKPKNKFNYHPQNHPNGWKGSSPMKLLSIPKKPAYSGLKTDMAKVPKSWDNFISMAYWSVELQNDNE